MGRVCGSGKGVGVGKVWVGRVYMKVGKVSGGEGKVYGGDGRGGMSLVDSTIPITYLSSNFT